MTRGKRAAGAIGVFVFAVMSLGVAHAGMLLRSSGWRLTNLGTAAGYTAGDVQPWGLNDRGEVVGTLSESVNGTVTSRAFAWKNGRMTLLEGGGDATAVNNQGTIIGDPIDTGRQSVGLVWFGAHPVSLATLGGTWSTPLAINAHGQIVGDSATASSQQHAFLWDAGTMTDLGTLGGTTSSATAISERGQIIGTSATVSGATHGFIWQNGQMTDIGSFFGADSRPAAINNQGVIVGTIMTRLGNPIVAFKWDMGRLSNLGRFGAPAAEAKDVNNRGVILVEATDAAGNPKYGLILNAGKTTNLGSLGGATTMAYHLNDRNQAIAFSFTRSPASRRSFVWQAGTMMALPTYDGVGPPWGSVSEINDVGDVIGTAYQHDRQAGAIWIPK